MNNQKYPEEWKDSKGRFRPGHKFSIGSDGRPRAHTPSDEDLDIFGQEMVKWVIENQPLHLSHYYHQILRITWDTFKRWKEQPIFRPYYEEAQSIISQQYLAKDSRIEPGMKQRFSRVYFKDLKTEEDEETLFKARAKAIADAAEKETAISPEQIKTLMDALKDDPGLLARLTGQSEKA